MLYIINRVYLFLRIVQISCSSVITQGPPAVFFSMAGQGLSDSEGMVEIDDICSLYVIGQINCS